MPGCPLCPRRRQPAPPGGLGHHSCMRATSPGNRFGVRGAWLLPESPHVICQTRLQAATKASVSCHTAGSGCRWGTALPRPRPPTSTFPAQRLPTGPRRCFSASDSASSSSLSPAPRPPPPPVLPAGGAVLGSLTRPPPCPASLREALGAGASAFRRLLRRPVTAPSPPLLLLPAAGACGAGRLGPSSSSAGPARVSPPPALRLRTLRLREVRRPGPWPRGLAQPAPRRPSPSAASRAPDGSGCLLLPLPLREAVAAPGGRPEEAPRRAGAGGARSAGVRGASDGPEGVRLSGKGAP